MIALIDIFSYGTYPKIYYQMKILADGRFEANVANYVMRLFNWIDSTYSTLDYTLSRPIYVLVFRIRFLAGASMYKVMKSHNDPGPVIAARFCNVFNQLTDDGTSLCNFHQRNNRLNRQARWGRNLSYTTRFNFFQLSTPSSKCREPLKNSNTLCFQVNPLITLQWVLYTLYIPLLNFIGRP